MKVMKSGKVAWFSVFFFFSKIIMFISIIFYQARLIGWSIEKVINSFWHQFIVILKHLTKSAKAFESSKHSTNIDHDRSNDIIWQCKVILLWWQENQCEEQRFFHFFPKQKHLNNLCCGRAIFTFLVQQTYFLINLREWFFLFILLPTKGSIASVRQQLLNHTKVTKGKNSGSSFLLEFFFAMKRMLTKTMAMKRMKMTTMTMMMMKKII